MSFSYGIKTVSLLVYSGMFSVVFLSLLMKQRLILDGEISYTHKTYGYNGTLHDFLHNPQKKKILKREPIRKESKTQFLYNSVSIIALLQALYPESIIPTPSEAGRPQPFAEPI
jgi:NADH:ubiquinone oxidoreductase subunit H